MQLREVAQLFFLNTALWFVFHFLISYLLTYVPVSLFSQTRFFKCLFQVYTWEKEGEFWERFTLVRRWKTLLPDGGEAFQNGFQKKKMKSLTLSYVEKFINETKRAELTHWVLLLPAPLFFIWNPVWAGWVNMVYSLIANLPFIIIQRFNRPRLIHLKKRLTRL